MLYSLEALILYFGVAGAAFKFLGFVYKDYGIKLGKITLKNLLEYLKNHTLFDLQKDYFSRIVEFVGSPPRKAFLIRFLSTMFILNVIIIPFSCLFAEYLKNASWHKAWVILCGYKMYTSGLIRTVLLHLVAGLIGVALNYLSLKVTLSFLKKMSIARGQLTVLLHLTFNLVIVAAISLFLVPTSVLFNWKVADANHVWKNIHDAWNGTFNDSRDMVIPVLYGATSAIPTSLYLVSGIILIMLWKFPRPLKKFFLALIGAIGRDDRNVLADLGNFFAAIAGLLAAAKFLFH